MRLVDAHCHLASLNQIMPVEVLLKEAKEAGITHFLSSALSKEEIAFHRQHSLPGVLFSAGIHPHYAGCDLELKDIEEVCAEHCVWAVGEIGLDRYGKDIEKQIKLFSQQLELAKHYQLPVVLHIVGYQQQAYELLKHYPLKYLVHGYAGSLEGYRLLSRLNSYFTISERILRPDKHNLLQEMVNDKRYLMETDITRDYVLPGEHNPLLRLLDVFEQIPNLCKVNADEVLSIQWDNFIALMEGK
jgi:TatD DNase family protein